MFILDRTILGTYFFCSEQRYVLHLKKRTIFEIVILQNIIIEKRLAFPIMHDLNTVPSIFCFIPFCSNRACNVLIYPSKLNEYLYIFLILVEGKAHKKSNAPRDRPEAFFIWVVRQSFYIANLNFSKVKLVIQLWIS